MKYKLQDMIAEGIRHFIVDRKTYLYWDDVKQNHPTAKIHTADILMHKIDGVETKLCRVEDIQQMTDFDQKIIQTLKFDPKKKTS